MKSVILTIISLFICINCYAAPAILDHQADYQPVIYIGDYYPGPNINSPCRIYTTKRSLDMMLNLYEYNGRDWYMDIFMEPVGQYRDMVVKQLADEKSITWLNTPSGSRIFWAIQYRTLSKNNILTLYPTEVYYNDHGELLGQCNTPEDVFDLSKYKDNFGMKGLNNAVINFLNKQFSKARNMDNGKPIK